MSPSGVKIVSTMNLCAQSASGRAPADTGCSITTHTHSIHAYNRRPVQRRVLFCSLAALDPRVGHTMDILSPFIPVLCHSDRLFHGESCPRLDVVHPGRAWPSSPMCTWHYSLHYLFLQATHLFPHGVTIVSRDEWSSRLHVWHTNRLCQQHRRTSLPTFNSSLSTVVAISAHLPTGHSLFHAHVALSATEVLLSQDDTIR